LNGEKRKYELGTSTLFNVVIAQRDATARALAETDAKNQYMRSNNALQQVLGRTLEIYNVDIDEAKSGTVKREADLIPAVQNQ
jgi:outer membrane protein TolC